MDNCLSCKHWSGPKKKQQRNINKYGVITMDLHKGWPEDGSCDVSHLWGEIEVTGDATATLIVNANHNCNRWEADDGK